MNAITNRLAINAVSYVDFQCDQDLSFDFAQQQDKGSFVLDTNAGCSVFNETR